jgi:Fic family protein
MINSWTLGYEGPIESLLEIYGNLEALKAKLDKARPLPVETVKSINGDMSLRYTYNSNAIEGNTLTLIETKVVLEDGLTIGGKTMREHLEAINHRDAIQLMEKMGQSKGPLSEAEVRGLHAVILRGIDDLNAGAWRHDNVRIYGATHIPPRAEKIFDLMSEFFAWSQGPAAQLPAVERAARLHVDFVAIHPFIDGNGRTARLLMNLELLRAGYPIAVISFEERQQYYHNLDAAVTFGNYEPFVRQVCAAVERSFNMYFEII